jgi:hypothetical protein
VLEGGNGKLTGNDGQGRARRETCRVLPKVTKALFVLYR